MPQQKQYKDMDERKIYKISLELRPTTMSDVSIIHYTNLVQNEGVE